jgi:hypothetical protein
MEVSGKLHATAALLPGKEPLAPMGRMQRLKIEDCFVEYVSK